MTVRTIAVLGGGAGGLVAAGELRRRLPEHRVVLVERKADHHYSASFLWLMTGARRPEQITQPVRQLAPPGVEVIQSEVRGLDLAGRRVEFDGRSLSYDYLVVALGAELAPEAIPGLSEGAHIFYNFEGALKLRDALPTFKGGTVAVVVSGMPYKCPGAPHEAAMLIGDFFRQRGRRDKVDIHLFTLEPQPMPVAGPQLGEAVQQMLRSKGVAFHPLHKLTAVNPGDRELSFEGKDSFKYDLLVAIPPHRGPRIVREAGLANEAGWLPVDRSTLATRSENVYAVGDVTALSLPGRWKPDVPLSLPKAGVFAQTEAMVVSRRIAAEINGARVEEVFCGDGSCMLEAGEGLAGFAFGNFFGEPSPQVQLRKMGRSWHWGKVLFEQWWLTPYGPKREALRLMLRLGSRMSGVPMTI
ncbi:MAG: FAD-dependent oxidoreductase [Chloroflexi bacterium]|nr:FAD-dependent oxidoreductase [Chloroflexota bacterium]